jgi:hypothetical protein
MVNVWVESWFVKKNRNHRFIGDETTYIGTIQEHLVMILIILMGDGIISESSCDRLKEKQTQMIK